MGRLKLAGDRYPCGKLKPETTAPAMVRRIIDAAKHKVVNPMFGTEIGRLRLKDVVTDSQVAAGLTYAEAVGTYDRLKGMPARTAAGQAYDRGYGSSSGLDFEDEMILQDLLENDAKLPAELKLSDWVRQEFNLKAAAKNSARLRMVIHAVKRYERLDAAVSAAGRDARRAMQDVLILNEPIASGRHIDLIKGLNSVKMVIAEWQRR